MVEGLRSTGGCEWMLCHCLAVECSPLRDRIFKWLVAPLAALEEASLLTTKPDSPSQWAWQLQLQGVVTELEWSFGGNEMMPQGSCLP
mmetsp:Transcript_93302/g.234461  ORF Transcript_93302/g.234461 Transcript_93302/m.234461 type:complete len:88 (-) Transcript_93302:99-362(-)